MKKILIIIVACLLFSSCGLVLHGPIEEGHPSTQVQQAAYTTLDCIDTFSIYGIVYTTKKSSLPITVYNPNLYTIVITVNGSAILTLESHSEERLYQ